MKTFYYVNGKRVSADTYFATGKNLEWKKYMYKACISYYRAHPDEFDAIARWTPKESLFTRLMLAWEKQMIMRKLMRDLKRDIEETC